MNSVFIRLLASSGASIICPGSNPTGTCSTGLPVVAANSNIIHVVLTIFFGVAAAVSVLMIIIGAFMFITSGGSPEKAGKARETIIYSAIGLVVSLSALSLVEFVLGHL